MLLRFDFLVLLLSQLLLLNCQLIQDDIDALQAIYTTFTSTGLLNWNFSANLCTQYGIECSDNRVVGLSLANSQIQGPLSTEIGKLVALDYLFLNGNELTGTIPTEIRLPYMSFLNLNDNQFSGTISTEIALGALYGMSLGNNNLSGTIPSEIGNSGYYYLDLHGNQLTGSLPKTLGNLVNLYELQLHDNQLSGPIPPQLSKLNQIYLLTLSNNQLTGTLPNTLKKLTSLSTLQLASNFLECPTLDYSQWTSGSDYSLSSTQCSNSCPPNQCSNGKVCSIAGASYDSFSCACRPGMTGSNCEISACDSIACQNGGTCLLDVFGNPFCKCSPGYKGNRCQKDLCIPSPCQNGGSGCVHNPYGYGCTSCPFPNAGFLCEAHNIFALVGNPLALYSFSTSNKLLDETGNGYDLSPFNAESVNYPHIKSDDPYGNDPMNEALILFGQDIISTASQLITLGNSFSVTVVFSISKFYLPTGLVIFTPSDLSAISSMSLNILPTGALQVTVKGISRFTSPASTISLNTLTVVTFTKQGNVLRIFKNDNQVASTTLSEPITITNNKMYLGYNFRGIFDKAAVYSFALSVATAPYAYYMLDPPLTACGGCQNGGICGKLETGKKCFCSQCWTGDKCEISIQGCLHPCQNGGTYDNGVCHCAAGYFGSQCESIQTCPPITSTTGNFPQSNAYQTVSGSCSSGSGNPRRQCLYDGTWQNVITPCT